MYSTIKAITHLFKSALSIYFVWSNIQNIPYYYYLKTPIDFGRRPLDITEKNKKNIEFYAQILTTTINNLYSDKNLELLQLSALMLFIVAINVILYACWGLLMLDSPSLKVLMNNKMTHLIEFVIQYVTRIRNRPQVSIIKKGIGKKMMGVSALLLPSDQDFISKISLSENTSRRNIIWKGIAILIA